jgi:hypothetical protein
VIYWISVLCLEGILLTDFPVCRREKSSLAEKWNVPELYITYMNYWRAVKAKT